MQPDLWTAREGVSTLDDEMEGFSVEARDGSVGKVDYVGYGGTCVVVATSRLRGKKHVVPAGFVERIDPAAEEIFVDLTKDEIEASPEYDDRVGLDEDCESRAGDYYAGLGARATAR